VADASGSAVRLYEIGSGQLTNTLPLQFLPTRFEPLSTSSTFLLNGDRSSEWLLILDAGPAPAISFVPAAREEVQ
jgi:hypothetical protein